MKKSIIFISYIFLEVWQVIMPANTIEHESLRQEHLEPSLIKQSENSELEKLEYFIKQFSLDISDQTTIERLGYYLRKYSAAITIASGLFYTMLIIYIYEHYLKGQRRERIISLEGQILQEKWLTYFPESGELLAYFDVAFLITDSLALTYILLKYVGKHLENNNQHFYQELINFVKTWNKHKTKTPQILHSLFEQLSIDFEKNGNLTNTDLKIVKNIVDVIIATSLYVNLA